MLHMDVKKLGRVPDGGGWRYVGRAEGGRNRIATATSRATGTPLPRNKHGKPLIGTCYLHTVIDDHSRVAYVEAHDDETKETAAAVLRNAVAAFGVAPRVWSLGSCRMVRCGMRPSRVHAARSLRNICARTTSGIDCEYGG